MRSQFPITLAQVTANLHSIIIFVSLLKICLAILFVGGEHRAGKAFVWVIYPLRLMFYYNPYSVSNLPSQVQVTPKFDLLAEQQATFEASAKLRKCYQEIEFSLIIIGCICLVLSSPQYQTSRWLRNFFKAIRQNWKLLRHWVRRTLRDL